MAKLILLRHFKSQWNKENRFSGWVDNPLSKEGKEQIKEISQKLTDIKIDVVYTSPLIRNQETVLELLKYFGNKYPIFKHFSGKMEKWAKFEGNGSYLPVYVSDALNERYYGKLQGLDKEEIRAKYGESQVHLWRRSYNVAPPGGESLKDVFKRAVPFYKKYAEKDLKEGRNVLVVASHNSLRALVKYIENIADRDIAGVELPFGGFMQYEFDGNQYTKFA